MRRESLSRSFLVTLAAVLAIAVAAVGLATAKEGKTGKAKRADIVSTTQSAIINAGAIQVKGGKGRIAVRGLGANGSPGALTKSGKAKGGKTISLPLTDGGKRLLSGCSVNSLQVFKAKKRKKKKGKKTAFAAASTEPLNRDLAVCSVGSENPTARTYIGPAIPTDNAERCDFLDPTVCMQPWPNDHFTIADSNTNTGRRVNFNPQSMPKNKNGVPIDVTDFNRADGFSPGNQIILKVPQVQTQAAFNNSGFVPVNNIRRYDDEGQPLVIIDADTGDRHPAFAELDANSPPDETNLIARPLRNFEEGHRYIVALRGLRDASNQPVDPPLPFRVYRDRLITTQTAIENRRPKMEDLITTLQGAGFARSNLYMAWDFTVASRDSLTGRALAMRDDALLRLGDTAPGDPITGTGDSTPGDGVVNGDAPDFNIGTVTNFVPCGGDGCQAGESDTLLRQIEGTLTNVPCYLTMQCHTLSSFTYASGADDPTLDPTTFADDDAAGTGVRFRCIIPRSVDAGTTVDPAKPGTYGHGLLGLYTQVNGQATLANQNNSLWCATNWAGFSDDDLTGGVISAMLDLSNFARLVDRMQQGFVNFHYLGRALVNPDGFSTDPAFQIDPDGPDPEPMTPVIDTSHLYFEGISQGAIMGGALTALSPDFTRSVLNVPGMNYSTLLRRSVDTAEYVEMPGVGLYENYPSLRERPLILSLMQLLWDRGETNGYAHHATSDPLPNTPQHQILLQLAYGDHQVANLTAEVEARTIGARLHSPALKPGRHWEANPFLQIPAIDFGSGPAYDPYSGSAIVYYDGGPVGFDGDSDCTDENSNPQHGTATPPNANVPPQPRSIYGCDPHGYPRRAVDGLAHVSTFLQPNGFILPCTTAGVARPCYANGYNGQ